MSGPQQFNTVGNGNNFDHPPSTIADPRQDETRQGPISPTGEVAGGLWGHMLRTNGDRHEVLPSNAAEVVDTTTDQAPHILARARMRSILEARRRASPGSLFTRLQHQRTSRATGQDDRNLLAELQQTNERARQLLDSGLDVTGAVPDNDRSADGQPRQKKRKTEVSSPASKLYPTPYGYHGQATATRLRMKLVSSDGGSCDDLHIPENVLKHDNSVYCTEDSRCNLVLSHEGETMFTISKLSIRAPSSGYSHPIQQGLVFVSNSKDEIFKKTRDYRINNSAHLTGASNSTPSSNTVGDPELGLRQWFRQYCDHSDDGGEDDEHDDETQSDRDTADALRDLVRRGDHTRQDRAARTARLQNASPPAIDTNTQPQPATNNAAGLLTPLSYFRLQPPVSNLPYTAATGRLPSYSHLAATTTLPTPPPPLWTQTTRPSCRSHHHTSNQADGYSAVKVTTRQDIGGNKLTLHFTPAVSARYLLLKLWQDDGAEHANAVPANAAGVMGDNITYADDVISRRLPNTAAYLAQSLNHRARLPRGSTPDSMPDLEPISPTSPPPENDDNNPNPNTNANDDDYDDDSDFDESAVPDIDIQEGIPITANDNVDSVRDRLISSGFGPRQARVLAERYYARRGTRTHAERRERPPTSENNDNPAAAPRAPQHPNILITAGDTIVGGYEPGRAAEMAGRFFGIGESDEDNEEGDDGEEDDDGVDDEDGDEDVDSNDDDPDEDEDEDEDADSDVEAPMSRTSALLALIRPTPRPTAPPALVVPPAAPLSTLPMPPFLTRPVRRHPPPAPPTAPPTDAMRRLNRRLHRNGRLTLGALATPRLIDPTGAGRLLSMPTNGVAASAMNALNTLNTLNSTVNGGNGGDAGMRGRWDVRRPNVDIERVEAWGTQGRVWAPSWDVL